MIRYVIFDEVHNIGAESHGETWEHIITLIRCVINYRHLYQPHCCIIINLSASILIMNTITTDSTLALPSPSTT